MRRRPARFVWFALLTGLLGAQPQAKITRIAITKAEPAFSGQSFGAAGVFERVIGRAHGELDPALPENSVIQDLGLAPRNARGMVEYTTDIAKVARSTLRCHISAAACWVSISASASPAVAGMSNSTTSTRRMSFHSAMVARPIR